MGDSRESPAASPHPAAPGRAETGLTGGIAKEMGKKAEVWCEAGAGGAASALEELLAPLGGWLANGTLLPRLLDTPLPIAFLFLFEFYT